MTEMLKKMIKKALRKVVRRIGSYVDGLEAETEANRDFSQDDIAYPRLNSLFSSLLSGNGGMLRPSYAWGVLHGVHLASALGIDRVSVMEFGVAGGLGLLALEEAATKIGPMFGVHVDVYGFDTGAGLPKPADYRDLPNLYTEGGFPMDVDKLRARLRNAQLVLGFIEETIPRFLESKPAPVAFISYDVDYYSSTMHAFKVLEADTGVLLPRVHCYFDDIMGFTCSEFTGERLAIAEFNAAHPMRKISLIYGLRYFLPPRYANEQWAEMIYFAHIFDHPLYGRNDGLVRRAVGCRTDIRD